MSPKSIKPKRQAKELVVCVDGGYVLDQNKKNHFIEEMVVTSYNPENKTVKSKRRAIINKKICVASALSDDQRSIKILTQNASLELGLNKDTEITALADGAKNCWSIIHSLEKLSHKTIKVLDWFHIKRKFRRCKNCLPKKFIKQGYRAKWYLWHGKTEKALYCLKQIMKGLKNKSAGTQIKRLTDYITNNEAHIINYQLRKINHLPYSSQLAETSVYSIINQRQKHQRMRWTRSGANELLQIRTSIFSDAWNKDWNLVSHKIVHFAY